MKSNLLSNLLIGAGVFLSAASFAQAPAANFSITSNTICAKGSVQVTDLSTNAPTAWSYSVNGSLYSTLQAPEIIFPTAGTYSIDLEATNGSGTSAVYTETVFVNALPSLTVTGNTLVCTSAASTLNASGADTYTWSSGQMINLITIYPASSSIYTLVGTSTLTGCSDSNFVSISTVPLPTITVSNATICSGQPYTITPTGASSYSYSGGASIVSPMVSTTYTVSGTDALTGCSDSVQVFLSVTNISLTSNSGNICAGQSFTIIPNGANSYSFSSGSGVVSPTVNTTYTVTGTDAVSGCTGSLAVTIGVNASPTITVNSGSICAGKIFTIQPTGASNYTYSSGSNTVTALTNTIVIVSGINVQTGCTGFATVSLSVTPLPIITVNSGTICSGDVFTITPGGAATYTLSNTSYTVMPVTSTNYSVTGTDASGCISQSAAVASVIVAGIKPVVGINTSQSNVICQGEMVIFTGTGASTYTWSTGATTSTAAVTPSVTTLFSVTGMDALSGCTANASILQYVSECSGIKTLSSVINYNAYPNPTSGDLTIEITAGMQVLITNAVGELILSQDLEAGTNVLSLSTKPAGIYFVTLKQNNDSKTLRIIKH